MCIPCIVGQFAVIGDELGLKGQKRMRPVVRLQTDLSTRGVSKLSWRIGIYRLSELSVTFT